VNLLVSHADGMPLAGIADALGLSAELVPAHREMIAAGIVELLVKSERILWDGGHGRYIDNPHKY
jgi:hypothetical protein